MKARDETVKEVVYPLSHPFGYYHECEGIAFWLDKRPAPFSPVVSAEIMVRIAGRFEPASPGSIIICASCKTPLGRLLSAASVLDLREPS